MKASEHETGEEPKQRRLRLLRPTLVAVAVLIGKAALVLRFDVRRLHMAPWVLDDTFIFTRIARNLALGRGYSFDGLNPTSGAPPLWIWLTSANHFTLGRDAAVHATLIESAVFAAASTVLVFALAWRLAGRKVAWLAFVLATLLAPSFFNSINGMETSLFTLLGLISIWLYMGRSAGKGTVSGYFSVGCALGLTNLARADGIFLLVAFLLVEALHLARSDASFRPGLIRRILALVSGTALFTLPLLLLCLHANGEVFPCNQLGRRLLSWEHAMRTDGTLMMSRLPGRLIYNILNLQRLFAISIGSAVVALVAVISGLVHDRGRNLARVALLYIVSYSGVLVFYQWYFPDVHGLRYLNLPTHILVIVLALFLARALSQVTGRFHLRDLCLALIACLLVTSSFYDYRELVRKFDISGLPRLIPSYTEEEVELAWQTIDWVAQNLPPGTVVAASDHGALAYFTDVSIVDLDGILDTEPVRAAWNGTIREVLAAKKVEYVILWPGTADRRFHKAIREGCVIRHDPGTPDAVYRLL